MARRRPLPDTPALIDARVLIAAALLVTPAAWQARQGLLSVDEVLTRYLLIALGCTLLMVVIRSVWPLVAGESPAATGGQGAEEQVVDRSAEVETGLS